jgi:hypothetical protein
MRAVDERAGRDTVRVALCFARDVIPSSLLDAKSWMDGHGLASTIEGLSPVEPAIREKASLVLFVFARWVALGVLSIWLGWLTRRSFSYSFAWQFCVVLRLRGALGTLLLDGV